MRKIKVAPQAGACPMGVSSTLYSTYICTNYLLHLRTVQDVFLALQDYSVLWPQV